jgi:hypothetical protein
MRFPSYYCLGLVLAVSAHAQQQPELRARELFYTPVEVKPATTPAKPVAVSRPKPATRPTQPRPVETGQSQSVQVAGRPQENPNAGLAEGAHMQKVSTLEPTQADGLVARRPL